MLLEGAVSLSSFAWSAGRRPLGLERLHRFRRPGDGTSGSRACVQPTCISYFSLIKPAPQPAPPQPIGKLCRRPTCGAGSLRSCAPGRPSPVSNLAAWRRPSPSV